MGEVIARCTHPAALVALLFLLVGLGGCEKRNQEAQAPPAPAEEEPYVPDATSGAMTYTVAVIPRASTDTFWKSVEAGARRAAEEYAVEIVWQAPSADDADSQIAVVEDSVARGVDGIILAPLDARALAGPVSAAARNDIPVVIIDSDVDSIGYVSFVATDNEKGGYLAGKHLGEALGGKGNVVMLRYQEGSAGTSSREAGFMRAMEEFSDITLIDASAYAGPTEETAFAASQNLLSRLEGEAAQIDGVFTSNASTTSGMLRALKDADRAGQVKLVGFGASEKLAEALQAGQIAALVVQDPENIGYTGVKTLVRHLQGSEVDRRIDTGVTLVTKDNMNDERIVELLSAP